MNENLHRLKKILFLVSLTCLVMGNVRSQNTTSIWTKLCNGTDFHWFNNGTSAGAVQGLAYNPITNKLLVARRTSTTGQHGIYVLNANTGALEDSLSITGVGTESFRFQKIRVSADGVIYAVSLATAAGTVKVYRWANQTATPVECANFTSTERCGDGFGLSGTGISTTLYLSGAMPSGAGNTKIYVLTTTNGTTFSNTSSITITSNGLSWASRTVEPIGASPSNGLWIKSTSSGGPARSIAVSGSGASLTGAVTYNGNTTPVSNKIPVEYSSARYLLTPQNKAYLAITASNSAASGKSLAIYNITDTNNISLAATDTIRVNASTPWTYQSNSNATGDIAFKQINDSTYDVFYLITNNGISCVRVGLVSTPPPPTSSISISGSLSAFTTCAGSISSSQQFTVSGSGLTANITITPPTGFEVSTTSGSGFGSSLSLTQSGGTVSATTVYVRLTNTASGTPSGNISCASSGATTQNVSVNGTVNALPTISVGSISTVLATATSFSLPYTATTGSPNQYSIVTSSPNAMPNFTSVTNATLTSSPIAVTIPMSASGVYNFNLTVKNSTTGCLSALTPFALTVGTPDPILTVIGTPAALSACIGSPSSIDSFTVSGSNLTANISLNAPTGFEISTSLASGYGSSLSLTQVSGTVAPTRIYVRLSSSATGMNTGNIVVFSSGDNSDVVPVSGTVNQNPSIALGTIASVLPSATTFNLIYTGTTGSPSQYSISTGTPTAMSGFVAVNNATLGSSPIAVTIPASAAGNYNFNLSLKNTTTGCTSNSIPFVLSVVNPSPTVSISGSFDPITACSGSASGAQQFKVNGIFLTGNLNVSAPAGFEIATTLTGAYGATIALNAVSGVLADTPLYVRMSSTASGTPSGNITCSSAGATDKTLAIIGIVTPNPAKPVISVQAADPICKGAEYLNFAAASEAPVGVIYQWSATNALLYAQGGTKQNALVSFPNSGDATITLTATANGCSSEVNITYSVLEEQTHTATVRYFNKNFVCEVNEVSKYQWGFDDLPSLKGNTISGEVNQNYFNANPDLVNKSYWAMTSKGNCYQKTYYNKPASVASIINNENSLVVYPNPFTNEITINSTNNIIGASVVVTDMNGKILNTFKVSTQQPKITFTELATGIYFIQLTSENGRVSNAKIIKY